MFPFYAAVGVIKLEKNPANFSAAVGAGASVGVSTGASGATSGATGATGATSGVTGASHEDGISTGKIISLAAKGLLYVPSISILLSYVELLHLI
jgi:hypothetical protein